MTCTHAGAGDPEKEAIVHCACPRCGALIGRFCMKPDGSKSAKPHWHRIRAWHQRPKEKG